MGLLEIGERDLSTVGQRGEVVQGGAGQRGRVVGERRVRAGDEEGAAVTARTGLVVGLVVQEGLHDGAGELVGVPADPHLLLVLRELEEFVALLAQRLPALGGGGAVAVGVGEGGVGVLAAHAAQDVEGDDVR